MSNEEEIMKLACILHEMFDLAFGNRKFEDCPEDTREMFIERARDLIAKMADPEWHECK